MKSTTDNKREDHHAARVDLLTLLKAEGYQFTTVTPVSHSVVLQRRQTSTARDLRDIFGWSLPFDERVLPADMLDCLNRAGALGSEKGRLTSKLRVSTLGVDLYLHSAFPTAQKNAVFFGPDTYRFARYLTQQLAGSGTPNLLADIGSGSGAGGLYASRLVAPKRLLLTDTNLLALELACANAAAAGLEADVVRAAGIDGPDEPADLIIANPPFIAGDEGAAYKDGGEMHGAQLSLDWALQAVGKLASGGRLLMYTGVAILDGGIDPFRAALEAQLPTSARLTYEEIDPDIFGDQLSQPAYQDVERIAAIGLCIEAAR